MAWLPHRPGSAKHGACDTTQQRLHELVRVLGCEHRHRRPRLHRLPRLHSLSRLYRLSRLRHWLLGLLQGLLLCHRLWLSTLLLRQLLPLLVQPPCKLQ